jgi:hypothetical protein
MKPSLKEVPVNKEFPETPKPAREFAINLVHGFKKKAGDEKDKTYFLSSVGVACTIIVPLFVTLASAPLYAKAIPAILSGVATFCATWVQYTKPEKLWTLYREAQRKLEREIEHFDFSVGDYDGLTQEEKEKHLAKASSEIAWGVHKGWLPHVPNAKELQKTAS